MDKGKRNAHGDALSVDGSEIGVLEEGHKVRLGSFLEGHNGRRLEAEIGLVVYHSTNHNQPRAIPIQARYTGKLD